MNHSDLPLPPSVAVLGSNGAIGATISAALQGRGLMVHDFDIQPKSGDEAGLSYTTLPHSSTEEYVEAFAHQVTKVRPAALVVASGVYPSRRISEETVSSLQSVITINAILPIRCIEAFIQAHSGSPTTIVVTSSLAALKPRAGVGAYAASKSALESLIQAAIIEHRKDDVRINVIRPGYVAAKSQMNPIPEKYHIKMNETGRSTSPEQLVSTYLWLLSDASEQLNGATIDVDRGMHLGTLEDAGWLD